MFSVRLRISQKATEKLILADNQHRFSTDGKSLPFPIMQCTELHSIKPNCPIVQYITLHYTASHSS